GGRAARRPRRPAGVLCADTRRGPLDLRGAGARRARLRAAARRGGRSGRSRGVRARHAAPHRALARPGGRGGADRAKKERVASGEISNWVMLARPASYSLLAIRCSPCPEAPVKLYSYFRSSAAYRARIALHLNGLPYEMA